MFNLKNVLLRGRKTKKREELEKTVGAKCFVVVNWTDKEERTLFSSLAEAVKFAEDTNGEIEAI